MAVGRIAYGSGDQEFIDRLIQYRKLTEHDADQLRGVAVAQKAPTRLLHESIECALFERFKRLEGFFPRVSFGGLPTPVQELAHLSQKLGVSIWAKRDDLTGGNGRRVEGRLFGGNKVRKLEFLLADAAACGAKSVITFGGIGSNHAVTTAACAREQGLGCTLILSPQPNSHCVRRNLKLMHLYGAHIYLNENADAYSDDVFRACLDSVARDEGIPYPIPFGGSCPLAEVGFVSAAYELKQQVDLGRCPQPDLIYVAAGSSGTAAGLLLGCKAAGLRSQIVAVPVLPDERRAWDVVATPTDYRGAIESIARDTNALLCAYVKQFPQCSFSDADLSVESAFVGEGYGCFTPEGQDAVHCMYECEGIQLDGTYTGKVLACLKCHAQEGRLQGKKALFWNTFCGRSFDEQCAALDYRQLPPAFHRFFEQEVQDLDC